MTQSTVARLERRPDGLAVGRVIQMLDRIGCGLAVTIEGAVVTTDAWLVSDLIARDSAGRRPPAHVRVERVIDSYRYEGRADGGPPLWRWRRS